jgi:oligoendopeptidase F
MELLSIDYWSVFFSDPEECKRAKKEHLEQILETLPWVACVDAFQHWVYENPTHTAEERELKWVEFHHGFSSNIIDWSHLEDIRKVMWQKQLHLYEVPFYYIEYGMAQLGAVAIWKNYKANPEKTVEQYLDALSLGYTASIGEIYATAGIKFDFSKEYIMSLMSFVKEQLARL